MMCLARYRFDFLYSRTTVHGATFLVDFRWVGLDQKVDRDGSRVLDAYPSLVQDTKDTRGFSARQRSPVRAVIQLSSRYKRDVVFIFTLLREADQFPIPILKVTSGQSTRDWRGH